MVSHKSISWLTKSFQFHAKWQVKQIRRSGDIYKACSSLLWWLPMNAQGHSFMPHTHLLTGPCWRSSLCIKSRGKWDLVSKCHHHFTTWTSSLKFLKLLNAQFSAKGITKVMCFGSIRVAPFPTKSQPNSSVFLVCINLPQLHSKWINFTSQLGD
jgi:hypothetical protein